MKICHCFLMFAVISGLLKGDSIDQQPDDIGTENEMKTLTCTYSTASANPCLYWYKQYPYSALEYILRQSSSSTACSSQVSNNDQRFSSNATSSTAVLTIMSLALTDTAVYYCVLGDSAADKLVFGKGTHLTVLPSKKEPNPPSVFVLRPQKGLSPAACLVKNFYPKDVKIYMNSKKGDVTPVLSQNGKYTAVYVEKSEEREVECKAKHEEKWVTESDVREILEDSNTSYEDKIDSRKNECKRPAGDSPGTTYENVNMLSMKILAVRFIFAKTLVFNLFLTAKCLLF
uniref:Ig-like domain-containing protein n=1 Tax=Xenopus tropicalis TaxID=8364 RepID=A0A803JU47_XENTR